MKSFLLIIAGVLGTLAAFAHQGVAVDYSWKTPVSGGFDSPGNWTPAGFPGMNDTVTFDLDSTGYTVDRNSGFLQQLKVGNDTVTFERSQLSMLATDLPAIQVGLKSGDVANVTFTDRISLSGTQMLFGEAQGSQATITLDDARLSDSGPTLPANRQFVIGGGGMATLDLKEGRIDVNGKVVIGRDAGSQGAFNVDGGFSSLDALGSGITVGQAGTGALTLKNQTIANVAGDLMVGEEAGSEGHIQIQDRSRFGTPGFGGHDMTSVTIGGAGSGSLMVTSNSQALLQGPMIVGRDEGSQGTVTVEGSQTELRPIGAGSPPPLGLTIGDAGKGTLTVQQGAEALFGNTITIGKAATGNGQLTVDGSATLRSAGFGSENVDKLIVGDNGTGKLTVKGSGQVSLSGTDAEIAKGTGSHGSVEVGGSGSTLLVRSLSIGAGGTGELTISSGGRVSVFNQTVENYASGTISLDNAVLDGFLGQNIDVQNSGKLINNGTIIGDVHNMAGGVVSGFGFITGTLFAQGGTIAPGNSPGTVIAGELDLNSVTVQVEMNSAIGTAGDFVGWDLVLAEGAAALSGSITIDLVSLSPLNDSGDVADFDPLQNYSWTVLSTKDGITGFPLVNVNIDTSAFTNEYSGQFFVTQVGDTLALNYAVPEPRAFALAIAGVIGIFAFRKRRCP